MKLRDDILSEEIIILCIEFDVVFLNILKQLVCSKDLGDFDELIIIIVTMEERFLAEDHRSKHGSKGPHIKGVVYVSII